MKKGKLCCMAILIVVSVSLLGCGSLGLGQKGSMGVAETFGPMPEEKLLGMAENRFKASDSDGALRAYEEFERAHPQSKLMPYCVFGQGMCYFSRLEKSDRDQTAARKAMENFQRVVERYPAWKYTADAKGKIAECRRLLAEHEFGIAAYYQKTGRHKAALVRYQTLARDYPNSSKVAEAEKGIAECQAELAKAPRPKGVIAQLFDAQW